MIKVSIHTHQSHYQVNSKVAKNQNSHTNTKNQTLLLKRPHKSFQTQPKLHFKRFYIKLTTTIHTTKLRFLMSRVSTTSINRSCINRSTAFDLDSFSKISNSRNTPQLQTFNKQTIKQYKMNSHKHNPKTEQNNIRNTLKGL